MNNYVVDLDGRKIPTTRKEYKIHLKDLYKKEVNVYLPDSYMVFLGAYKTEIEISRIYRANDKLKDEIDNWTKWINEEIEKEKHEVNRK